MLKIHIFGLPHTGTQPECCWKPKQKYEKCIQLYIVFFMQSLCKMCFLSFHICFILNLYVFIAYRGFYNDRIHVYNDDSVYVYDNPQQFYNFFVLLSPSGNYELLFL